MLSDSHLQSLDAWFPQLSADPELVRDISASGIAASLPRGRNICLEGERCDHLALVTSGSARVFKLAESGREITLYRVEPGECCILTASCILSARTFPANAMVEGPLDALLIPQSRVHDWMTTRPAWRSYVWQMLAERFGDVISLVEEITFRRMDERLADYLIIQAQEKGPRLQMTHQDIAADLGTSREVVSRILKDFESRDLLTLGRSLIEIPQPARLQVISRLRD